MRLESSQESPRVHCLRESFFLRFRAEHHRLLFYEKLVILRELESTFLESFAKIIQLWEVVVAGGAGRLIFTEKAGIAFPVGTTTSKPARKMQTSTAAATRGSLANLVFIK